MRPLIVTAMALALAAATAGIVARAEGSQPSPSPMPTLPVVNVDDMMGMYPQQTVFVATADHISAVTLLNHFIRFQLPTQGGAEVEADPATRSLYVLDDDTRGARRLRAFDLTLGTQRASMEGISDVAPGGHALGTTADARVLVLKSNADQAWVAAYPRDTLETPGVVMLAPACADRLLTSAIRFAVVCSATGEVTLGTSDGVSTALDSPISSLIGAAMGRVDGALWVLSADARLATVPAGSLTLSEIAWPGGWLGALVPDGLAVEQGGAYVLLAQATDSDAWLRVMPTRDASPPRSYRLSGAPNGGLVAMWPFAYYAFGGSIRHVDFNSGLLEVMAEVGAGAMPRTVVDG